jgi:hypothetical protein
MKLHKLAPFLSEATVEDDPFGPQKQLGVSPELIQRLEKQEYAVNRELWHTKEGVYNLVDHGVGCRTVNSYPGGKEQAKKDVADKKLIQITIDRDWGKGKMRRGRLVWNNKTSYVFWNTPEGLSLLHKVTERIVRVHSLMARQERIHAKLLRDRRTIADRQVKARRAVAQAAANARFGKTP